MKISINWLNDFVDLSGISTDEIIKRFNLATAEIEGAEHKGANIDKVITARIKKISKHPNSDRLQIMQLDIGADEPVQVLTTATNIYEGMTTAFVQVGGKVAGQKIGKAVMGGEPSYGMGCSESDLGIGSDDAGLWDIKEDIPLGKDIKELWPIDDTVFEIDNKTLSNRPDLWGHLGIAREMAAIFGRPLRMPKLHDTQPYNNLKSVPISLETNSCFRYSAIGVDNVSRKTSPTWLKIRLNYAGMRDINFITDLTNYTMLELGQPMHAFDKQKVDSIKVVEAAEGTKMTTLEKEEHTLPKGAITICNGQGTPVAVAGIKGGLLSGISQDTNSFLLESAVFEASAIRKTSKAIGLSTDASIRYEKSLDPTGTITSIQRVLALISDLDPTAKVSTALSDKINFLYPTREIEFNPSFITKRIGINIPTEKMVKILEALTFRVQKIDNDTYKVVVPSFRATKDVSIREDLVEEIARMYGYDNIQAAPLDGDLAPVVQSKEHIAEYKAKRLLAEKYGTHEVHTYVWKYKEFCDRLKIDMPVYVSLLDSSNSGQSGIRSALLPTLLKVYEENKNSTMPLNIAEIGRAVTGLTADNTSIEEKHLAILFAAEKSNEEHTLNQILSAITNIASSLFDTVVEYVPTQKAPNYFSSINSAQIKGANKQILGYVGLINEKMGTMLDKRYAVAMAELNFTMLSKQPPQKRGKLNISKYQSTKVDFNFLVDAKSTYADFNRVVKMFNPKLITEFSLIDVFESEKLNGKKSYTLRAEICSAEKTLTGDDIDRFRNKFIDHMARNGITMKD